MNGDLIFASKIVCVDNSERNYKDEIDIIYRLINFDNIYFFAEEISTGSIFPIYNVAASDDTNKNKIRFKDYSYIRSGKYFVFGTVIYENEIFRYKYYEDEETLSKFRIRKPSVDEVNNYLYKHRNDRRWYEKIKKMESENEFMCDINLIKEKINKLRDGGKPFIFNDSQDNINDGYNSQVDLSEISELGFDLSSKRDLCNLVGRDNEKKQIIKTVCIGEESTILVGESGSGKTAIVESLALDIKNKQNKWLKGKVLFNLSAGCLTANTKYRGEFEDKIMKLIKFCQNNKGRIILFIDEIHTLYKLGSSENSSLDAMNILKPYITNGDITIIGATTSREYEEYIAIDEAFSRRLRKIDITTTDLNMNIQIIEDYISYLENKYNVKFGLSTQEKDYFVKYIISVTDKKNQRVVGDIKENNPSISKKIIKDAFEEAIYNEHESVTIEDISFAILNCDRLSPSFKKAKAEEIKERLLSTKSTNKVLTFVK